MKVKALCTYRIVMLIFVATLIATSLCFCRTRSITTFC